MMKKESKLTVGFEVIKKISIRKHVRSGIMYTLITVLIGVGIFLFISERNPKYIDQKVPVLPYTNKADVTYEVFTIANDLFTEKSYGPGGIYITSLVDHIDTIFKYEYSCEQPADLGGKYSIIADLEGFVMDEKGILTIWRKNYTLLPETSFITKNKKLIIEKKISVKLSDYNAYMEMVRRTLSFGYNVKLVIKWNIINEIKTLEGSKIEIITPIMEIPMTKDYFEVSGELTQENKGVVEKTEKVISPVYIKIKTGCWIGAALCVVLLIFMLVFTKPYTIDSPLQKKLKKVFKSHGSRMVGLGSETTINANELIEVSSMEDLVKIADDVGRPVMYRKSINPEDIYYFYVIEENNIYVFDIRKTIVYPPTEKTTGTDTMSI